MAEPDTSEPVCAGKVVELHEERLFAWSFDRVIALASGTDREKFAEEFAICVKWLDETIELASEHGLTATEAKHRDLKARILATKDEPWKLEHIKVK